MPHAGRQELADLAAQALIAHGCAREEAAEVADRLLEANIKGHDSHGVQLVPLYVSRLKSGMIVPGKHANVVRQSGSILVVDGQRGFGQVIGRETVELALPIAREHGVALVALRQVHHLGRIGAWAEMCAAQRFASIHFLNVTGARLVAPHGGIDRRFGTNPVTLGMPAPDGDAIVLDMATSQVAAGKVAVADRRGEPVPLGSLIGDDGEITTDASRLYGKGTAALMPFGEHKGFGLAFFCELLAGALGGSVGNHPDNGFDGGVYNNMLSIIIDTSVATPHETVMDEIRRIVDWTLSARARPGMEVMLPGEPERRAAAERTRDGIWVEEKTWNELRELAGAA